MSCSQLLCASRRSVLCESILAATFCLPLLLNAQRQPLVMAHGIRSDSSTWSLNAPLLEQRFPVQVLARTTPWQAAQTTQATILRANILDALPESTIAIGHSNGGIVLRQAAMDGAPIRALMTIGSLNSGAPAAQNVSAGSMPGIVGPLLEDVALFVQNFVFSNIDFEDFFIAYLMNGAVSELVNDVQSLLLANVGFDQNSSGWDTMYPSSGYILGLNSTASLQQQIQEVPIRAYVRTTIGNPDNALYRLGLSESGSENAVAVASYLAFALYEGGYQLQYKYCGNNNYTYQQCNATQYLIYAAQDLGTMPGRYCARMMNEGVPVNSLTPGICGESDAVVPYQNQVWQANAFAYELDRVAHTEQTKNGDVLATIENFLETRNSIDRCGAGPAFSISVGAAPESLYPGYSSPLAVAVNDRCAVRTASASIIASSSDPNVATVVILPLQQVYVNANAVGTTVLTFQSGGLIATIAITVTQQPYF